MTVINYFIKFYIEILRWSFAWIEDRYGNSFVENYIAFFVKLKSVVYSYYSEQRQGSSRISRSQKQQNRWMLDEPKYLALSVGYSLLPHFIFKLHSNFFCLDLKITIKSSHRRCSVNAVLRNFAKFTGKHLCQGLFFNKVASVPF